MSCDTSADNAAFRDKFSYPFDLLCDESREMSMAYGAADAPDASYAKRISYLIGADGKVAKAYGDVKPAEHPAEVLNDLA